MTDFNQAIVLGNLTRDPEVRTTPNGKSVASFSVATNRRWTNRETNQPQEEVEFHNVVAWGKLAEICGQILYKGRKVLIAGRLRTRSWEGQDGVQRRTTEIIADHISATGASRSTGGQNLTATETKEEEKTKEKSASRGSANSEKEEKPKNKNEENSEEINLDDIPF